MTTKAEATKRVAEMVLTSGIPFKNPNTARDIAGYMEDGRTDLYIDFGRTFHITASLSLNWDSTLYGTTPRVAVNLPSCHGSGAMVAGFLALAGRVVALAGEIESELSQMRIEAPKRGDTRSVKDPSRARDEDRDDDR